MFSSALVVACLNWYRGKFAGRRSADEQGASLVEYALLLSLIVVVCLTAMAFLGTSLSTSFNSSGSQITP
jgi:Flp pilus assembly pilin Flp